MLFVYQKYYLRLLIGGLLVVTLFMAEYFIWYNLEPHINNNYFILLTVIIMLIVVNVIFKHLEQFVIRTGEILINDDGGLKVVLSNKIYKMCEIEEASFYTFKIYGVLIGEIYIEFKDEKSNKKNMKIFSEDLQNKRFIDTSLYEAMHLNIPNMTELVD